MKNEWKEKLVLLVKENQLAAEGFVFIVICLIWASISGCSEIR